MRTKCIVCKRRLPQERAQAGAATCGAQICHETLVKVCEKKFGTHKQVLNFYTGKVHLVPVRDLVLLVDKGLKTEELERYPQVEPTLEEAIKLEGAILRLLGVKAVKKHGKRGIEFHDIFIPAEEPKPGEPAAFICSPVEGHEAVPGSIKEKCSECGIEVWLAPSSQELRRRRPDMPCVCYPCVMKKLEEDNGPRPLGSREILE